LELEARGEHLTFRCVPQGLLKIAQAFKPWHYPERLRLNLRVSNSCKSNVCALGGKLRQVRHVYSNRAIERPSSSVGAAFLLVAEGRSVCRWSIERCRSYGAWLNSGAVLAIDMALLQELEAPANQIPQSQEIRAAKMRPSQMWVMPRLSSLGSASKRGSSPEGTVENARIYRVLYKN